jgi:hypothetical protein
LNAQKPIPDKPEITNYKHQITTSKSQIRSKANSWSAVGGLVIVICPSTWLKVVKWLGGELVEPFVICLLAIVI